MCNCVHSFEMFVFLDFSLNNNHIIHISETLYFDVRKGLDIFAISGVIRVFFMQYGIKAKSFTLNLESNSITVSFHNHAYDAIKRMLVDANVNLPDDMYNILFFLLFSLLEN